jgi:hypothetical protein
MRWTLSLALFSSLLLTIPACKPRQASQSASDHQSLHQVTDVCALLSRQEIEAVQGSPITGTKSSGESQEVFRLSQCYYSAAESSKSVSLALTEANPSYKGKRSPKDFWNETFGPYDHQGKEADPSPNERRNEASAKLDGEKEEQAAPPRKIENVGDDAFWVGNRVGGALYVLKNNAILRISVGGADNQETKITKSKALVSKALPRL